MTLEQLKLADEGGQRPATWVTDSTPRAEKVKGICSVSLQVI